MGNQSSMQAAHAHDPEEGQEGELGGVSPDHPRAAKLFCFDNDQGRWLLLDPAVVPEFEEVEGEEDMEDGRYLELAGQLQARVTDHLRLTVDQAKCTWHFYYDQTYCLKFYTAEGFAHCTNLYEDNLFQNTFNLEPTEENKEKVYGQGSYGEIFDNEEEFWDADDGPAPPPEPRTPGSAVRERRAAHSESRACQLEMGGLDNSFLVREGCVDVYRNQMDGLEGTQCSIALKGPQGGSLTPAKALLSQRETNMLMLTPDPKQRASIFQMDLEQEKVVSEWKFVKDGVEIPMGDIATDSKSAQMEDSHLFLGLDQHRICRWDTRTAQGVVQTTPVALDYSAGHDFSKKMSFRCMAATGDGHIAIGSDDGSVRLYTDRSLTRAKTAFPGLGAPITAIDVSFDGTWVLATTDTYLLLINTVFRDSKTNDPTTGFQKSMGAKMTAPRLLMLLPEDTRKMGGAKLSKGRFTWVTEQGAQERWIVASAGNYSVCWNFRAVKQNQKVNSKGMKVCMDYHISNAKDEQVVESAFMHDRFNANTNQLVVATEHDLFSCSGMDID